MSKPIASTLSANPWYKEFWPWFIIALLGSVVTASLITVSIAFRHADDLVVDDYYKVGLAINQRLEHREAAQRLGIDITLSLTGEQVFLSTRNVAPSSELTLLLAHPMEADKDFTVTLLPGPDGVFFATLPTQVSHAWHWSVSGAEPEVWLVSGVIDEKAFSNDSP
ncbi:FixH family protein [Aequoribacter sp.]|uniref:FixH family protein n=1 Tax=Aequoribacter sp. TaxID=2847771 RepID=UPI003F6979BC